MNIFVYFNKSRIQHWTIQCQWSRCISFFSDIGKGSKGVEAKEWIKDQDFWKFLLLMPTRLGDPTLIVAVILKIPSQMEWHWTALAILAIFSVIRTKHYFGCGSCFPNCFASLLTPYCHENSERVGQKGLPVSLGGGAGCGVRAA